LAPGLTFLGLALWMLPPEYEGSTQLDVDQWTRPAIGPFLNGPFYANQIIGHAPYSTNLIKE